MKPLVSLQRVAKSYGGRAVVQGLDIDLAPAGFVSVLGASGCGKSTVLRLLAGLETPSAGRVHWHAAADDGADRARRLGCVFQEPTLMPWASAADNVYLPLRLAGIARTAASDRVQAALAGVGLTQAGRALPQALSGGMKMRVSIARALIQQPTLLLMDEPFAALDEITRQQLGADLLALWHARRFAVLFVTHSVFEAVFLSQRVIVLAAARGQPATVAADIAIDAPALRDERFRGSASYAAQCAAVSERLRSAMGHAVARADG